MAVAPKIPAVPKFEISKVMSWKEKILTIYTPNFPPYYSVKYFHLTAKLSKKKILLPLPIPP